MELATRPVVHPPVAQVALPLHHKVIPRPLVRTEAMELPVSERAPETAAQVLTAEVPVDPGLAHSTDLLMAMPEQLRAAEAAEVEQLTTAVLGPEAAAVQVELS